MNIDQWKKEDGSYVTPDGKKYATAKSLIIEGLLGFSPQKKEDDVLQHIWIMLRGLKVMPNPMDYAPEDVERMAADTKEWEFSVYHTTAGSLSFNMAYFEKCGLFNPNGGIEGKWLTELGEKFLEDLESIYGKKA